MSEENQDRKYPIYFTKEEIEMLDCTIILSKSKVVNTFPDDVLSNDRKFTIKQVYTIYEKELPILKNLLKSLKEQIKDTYENEIRWCE